jgi:hypothetical protein
MKRAPLLLSLSLIALPITAVPSNASTGSVNISGGVNLNSSQEDLPSVALDLFWGLDGWPVQLNPYFSGSWDKDWQSFDGEDVLTVDYEAGLGVSRVWNVGSLHPHFGGGIGRLWRRSYQDDSNIETEVASRSDTGLWASGGVFSRLRSGLNVGAIVRLSGFAQPGSHLGGTHMALTVGWGWPSP